MAQWQCMACEDVHDGGSIPPSLCTCGRALGGWRWVGRSQPDGPKLRRRGRRRSGVTGRVRARVYKRDGHACVRCGETRRKLLTIDHITPRSRGGSDEEDNLQTLCRDCNCLKADQLPAYGETLPARLLAA